MSDLEWTEENFGLSSGPFQIERCISGEQKFISLSLDIPFKGENWDLAKYVAMKLQTIIDDEIPYYYR